MLEARNAGFRRNTRSTPRLEHDERDSQDVLGFAVHRTDHTEDEAFWLEGIKVFEETDPGTAKASLRSHPVQGFTWSDFTAKPGHEYTYRVSGS